MGKKRLFLWMISLTMLAGLINALSIFYYGTTVSHVTGLISNFAISLSKGDFSSALTLILVILSFFLGALISGIITAERKFYLYFRYGFVIISIGLLLALGVLVLDHEGKNLVRLFAFLMGLQNGMVVSFRGVVVRMTHMSGNLTDLGVYLGYKISGKTKEDSSLGIVPFGCLIGFTLGGVIGMLLYSLVGINAFYIASIVYLILGGVYFILQRTCRDKDFNGIEDELEKEEALNQENK